MNYKTALLILVSTLSLLWGQAATAVEFTVEDVSVPQFVCDRYFPSETGQLAGTCLSWRAPHTYMLTIVTQPGDFKLRCNGDICWPGYETYIVALYQGRAYVFGHFGWQLLPADIDNVQPSFPWHVPMSVLNPNRVVPYADILTLSFGLTYPGADLDGLPEDAEVYVLVGPVGEKRFIPGNIARIWPR